MWHIIASRHSEKLMPSVWQGEYYGGMQKQMIEFSKLGYKHFDVWEVEDHG